MAAQHGRSVAVMLDLTGPELRTSYLVDYATKQRVKSIEVEVGDVVTLYGEDGTNPDRFVGYKSGNRVSDGQPHSVDMHFPHFLGMRFP